LVRASSSDWLAAGSKSRWEAGRLFSKGVVGWLRFIVKPLFSDNGSLALNAIGSLALGDIGSFDSAT
jgi:hypothetical protein